MLSFPVVMSAIALAIVLGYAVMFGVAPQADEGLAAHTWQILMVGQFPCHRLLCYQVASDPAQASTTRSWLATRCGPGCDDPGLVVSLVTVSFETIYRL